MATVPVQTHAVLLACNKVKLNVCRRRRHKTPSPRHGTRWRSSLSEQIRRRFHGSDRRCRHPSLPHRLPFLPPRPPPPAPVAQRVTNARLRHRCTFMTSWPFPGGHANVYSLSSIMYIHWPCGRLLISLPVQLNRFPGPITTAE